MGGLHSSRVTLPRTVGLGSGDENVCQILEKGDNEVHGEDE